MRAAVLREPRRPLVFEERPDPTPRAGEIALRVVGCGVCHSDLHVIEEEHRELPLVLGHEITGEDDELGPVLVYAAWGCGRCRFCEAGEEQLCAGLVQPGFERDGGYAERVLVPSRRYLVPLDGLEPVAAAPLADAGITAYRAVRRARQLVPIGGTALVVGVGGVGQFAVQYLKLMTDAHVVAADPAEAKQQRAVELGADAAASPEDIDEPARIVFDFVGTDASLALAAARVEPTGVVVLVGAGGGRLPFGLGSVPWEVRFTTSIFGSRDELGAVLDLARRGEITWHAEALPLERANEALERLRRGEVLGRLVLTP